MKRYESALYARGLMYVAGVDEVGRGPLAGPVCAAAVVLPPDFDVLGVDDSKKLSEKKRESLYALITERALAWGVGFADNERIDGINILNATKEAMLAALREAEAGLRKKCGERERREDRGDVVLSGISDPNASDARDSAHVIDHVLVDAVALPEAGIPVTAIVKGDQKSVSVAAASIVAKVTRDRLMIRLDAVYPGYAFASNKGYGTKAHYEGLAKLGLTPIHRRTFCGARDVSPNP
ncbi:MAG: ribonuclease HII [Clostridiales Family XIII bacterium]|nr:ribonuclease HII [Clostridiales Family XIII bacterium]